MLVLGILVPILGVTVLSASIVSERWEQRAVATDLEHAASDLGDTVDVVADLAAEEAYSTILALGRDLGLETPGVRPSDLRDVRARVDASPVLPATAPDGALDDLATVRAQLDRGEASFATVSTAFLRLTTALEDRWRAQMTEIEQRVTGHTLPADLQRDLQTLRQSIEAFAPSSDRIRVALELLFGGADTENVTELITLNGRFEDAVARVDPAPGSAADAAWRSFRTDPEAQATEELLALAERVGLREVASPFATDLDAFVPAMQDGVTWALKLTDTVEQGAGDLERAAVAARDAATNDVVLWAGGSAALALGSMLIALLIARKLAGPAADLEHAARRVEAGEFELPPMREAGPRELRATIAAFNDMAATLGAVEERTVALAEDPGSPRLRDPLPGRTGRALQAALDVLQESMRRADERRAELTELATRDGLTGLLNRTASLDAIERDLARAKREGNRLVALYVDLDGLKTLNDTSGHATGDEAIRSIGDALASTTRDGDIVARLGGDEFVVVGNVPDGGADAVETFAQRIRAAVRARTVWIAPGQELPLTCSIGIALSGPGRDTADTLLRAADHAMYTAKTRGRDQVAWYQEPTDETQGPELVPHE